MRTGCAHLLNGENSSPTAVTYYKERVQSSSRSGKVALGPGEPRKVRGTQRGSGDPKGSPREPEGSQGIPGKVRGSQGASGSVKRISGNLRRVRDPRKARGEQKVRKDQRNSREARGA